MLSLKHYLKRTSLPIPPMVFAYLLLGVSSSQLLAQEAAAVQESEAQRLYRLSYEAAMADSVLSVDEVQLLRTLRQSLGIPGDIIDEALGEPPPVAAPGLNQSGRWTLMLQNMGWGLGLYGWGIPFVLDVKDGKWYVGGEMFSLGASLYLTWKYTANMDLPEARSHMQRYGGTVALQYGRALNGLLGYWDNDELDRAEIVVLMGAIPAGLYGGDRLYQQWKPSTGMAYALTLYGELGTAFMGTLHRQLGDPEPVDPYDMYDQDPFDSAIPPPDYEAYDAADRDWRKQRLRYTIAGYPLGTYLGHRLYGNRQYSFGDAALLMVGRGTGAFYGIILADLLDFDLAENDMGWRWLVMGGGLGGVVGMDWYMRGYDFTFGQAAIMTLGGVAGAAFATGFGVIMEIEEINYYELAAIGGSLGGVALARRIVSPQPESSRALGPESGPRLDLALQPMMVAGSLRPGLNLALRW